MQKILKEKKNIDFLINSHKESKKEEKDLYDIFLLANEENNKQIIDEMVLGHKPDPNEHGGDEWAKLEKDTNLAIDRITKIIGD